MERDRYMGRKRSKGKRRENERKGMNEKKSERVGTQTNFKIRPALET